jgi:hypothetical protein
MPRFVRVSLALLIAGMAGYLLDAAVLQARLHHGTAYQVIEVDQFLRTPLKGQKDEYDLTGQISVTCVRSVFPQVGYSPCWWVERHRTQWN